MPKLILLRDGAVVREIPLGPAPVSVGRAADNGIVIDDPAVSSVHCRISVQGSVCYVEDLQSTNGTFVNAKRVTVSSVRHDDAIGLGGDRHVLVVCEERLQAPAPPPPTERRPVLQVISGIVNNVLQYELSGDSTRIGTSEEAQVKIKAGGIFAFAPKLAAAIHRRQGGYVLTALKDGYPRLNGKDLSGEAPLKGGDLIECGATVLRFDLR